MKVLTKFIRGCNLKQTNKQTNKQTYYCGMEGGSVIY